MTPQAVFRDVIQQKLSIWNRRCGKKREPHPSSCSRRDGETNRLSDPCLFLFAPFVLPIRCYFVTPFGFSLTSPQGVKIPGLSWSCQFHGKHPARWTRWQELKGVWQSLWSHFQLLCTSREAPVLLIPLPHCDWKGARGEFAFIPVCGLLASPLREATPPGAKSVQVDVQKSRG